MPVINFVASRFKVTHHLLHRHHYHGPVCQSLNPHRSHRKYCTCVDQCMLGSCHGRNISARNSLSCICVLPSFTGSLVGTGVMGLQLSSSSGKDSVLFAYWILNFLKMYIVLLISKKFRRTSNYGHRKPD